MQYKKRFIVVATLMMAVVAAPALAGDMGAEEKAIRALDEQWVAAVAAGDIEAIAGLYAADGLFMPTGSPPVEGPAAIGEAWAGLMAIPGVALSFAPTRIEVAESDDVAIDIGTYSLSFDDGNGGRVEDEGKYVVTWRKIDGEWKVTADIFNTNLSAQ